MSGFRVGNHRFWRSDGSDEEATEPKTGPQPEDSMPPPSLDALDARMRALGPLGYPARAHDFVFGGWLSRTKLVYAVRFVLVVVAVVLFVGGVNGESQVDYEVGQHRAVTPAAQIDVLVAEGSTSKYSVQVRSMSDNPVSAVFGTDSGIVSVPSTGVESGNQYGLRVRVIRLDEGIQPRLYASGPPGKDLTTVRPSSDDGTSLTYASIPLDETGSFVLALASDQGKGGVLLQVQVTRAAVAEVRDLPVEWPALLAGLAMAIVVIGAYTPGAIVLRQRRRLRAEAEDRAYAAMPVPTGPPPHNGYARVQAGRVGHLAHGTPEKGERERLARMPGDGWVIRLD